MPLHNVNINTPANKAGSDCTGLDAATNRTLTMSGANISISGKYSVAINGAFLHEGAGKDYTVASNVITFLNQVWDIDNIRVIPH